MVAGHGSVDPYPGPSAWQCTQSPRHMAVLQETVGLQRTCRQGRLLHSLELRGRVRGELRKHTQDANSQPSYTLTVTS